MNSIRKNISKIYIVLILIFIPLSFQNSIKTVKAQAITNISVHEAYAMINNSALYPKLIILDVRDQSEYDVNHICNAILIPVTELESRIDELESYNNTEIIVYCQTGGRSTSASQILVNNGFTKIYNMGGGITEWISSGYDVCPMENSQTDFPSITDISVHEAYVMINNSTLYPNLIILDVRDQSEYDVNHICNAILIPVTELESRIDELESYNNTEIIVYCQTGGRSTSASQILVNNGFTKIYNMGGGISEWISSGYDVCPMENDQTNSPSTISYSFSFIIIGFLAFTIIFIIFRKKVL
ncbi:MAG: rhodanese-like domain-containing protein [Promethearchaeota archaeon]